MSCSIQQHYANRDFSSLDFPGQNHLLDIFHKSYIKPKGKEERNVEEKEGGKK
jgi:hypothetical protein